MWTWLTNVKLTIPQYLKLSVAALIGVLVIALKIQNEQLHQARIALLKDAHQAEEQKAQSVIEAANSAVSARRMQYVKAVDAYMSSQSASK